MFATSAIYTTVCLFIELDTLKTNDFNSNRDFRMVFLNHWRFHTHTVSYLHWHKACNILLRWLIRNWLPSGWSDASWSMPLDNLGSGCGLAGRAVASDTSDPRFKSSHRQTFIEHLFSVNCVEKTKIKKKEAGNGPFFKRCIHRVMKE